MATVGAVNVKLTAITKPFTKGLRTAATSVSGFTKRLAAVGKGAALAGAALAAAGTAAVGAFAVKIKGAVEELDQLVKTARKLGTSTDALIGLQVAADRTGVSAQTMNMALQRMVRRLSEAAQGTGEARNAVKELGLDAQVLAKLSPEKQFAVLADAMEGVASQGDRVRLAMKFFDSEGVSLVNTMEGGSKALAAFQQEAERLGLTVGGSGGVAEGAVDAFARIRDVFKGLFRQVAVQVAPAVDELATKLLDMGLASKGIQAVANAVKPFASAVLALTDFLAHLDRTQAAFNVVVQQAQFKLLESMQRIFTALQKFAAVIPGLDFTDAIDALERTSNQAFVGLYLAVRELRAIQAAGKQDGWGLEQAGAQMGAALAAAARQSLPSELTGQGRSARVRARLSRFAERASGVSGVVSGRTELATRGSQAAARIISAARSPDVRMEDRRHQDAQKARFKQVRNGEQLLELFEQLQVFKLGAAGTL